MWMLKIVESVQVILIYVKTNIAGISKRSLSAVRNRVKSSSVLRMTNSKKDLFS
jgi:hypothetical protein